MCVIGALPTEFCSFLEFAAVTHHSVAAFDVKDRVVPCEPCAIDRVGLSQFGPFLAWRRQRLLQSFDACLVGTLPFLSFVSKGKD